MVMTANPIKVLLLDDEAEVIQLLAKYLTDRGYSVFTANNGEDGLKIMETTQIDIVICDIVMPKMDGIEFLKSVRAYNATAQIIMITGQPTFENTLKVVENAACQFLIKPVSREDILKSLQKAEAYLKDKDEMIIKGLSAVKQLRK